MQLKLRDFSFLRKIDFQDAAPGETGRLSSSPQRISFKPCLGYNYIQTIEKEERR